MDEKKFEIRLLDHNIVEIVFPDKVYLDISLTDKIDEQLQLLAPDRKVYQLVIAQQPYIVNPEMRNSMAQGDTGIKQLAIAWVSPEEETNREQEEIVSKLPLPVPVRFFTARDKGLDWLRSLARE